MFKLAAAFSVIIAGFLFGSASALSPVISAAQLGGSGSGTSQQEVFQIYNNSNDDIDVTNWCLESGSSTLACFVSPDSNTKLILEAKQAILIGSSQFHLAYPLVNLDYVYSASNIPGTNGSLRIINSSTALIDQLGWGSEIGEGNSIQGNLAGGKAYLRVSNDGGITLQDTNYNAADFIVGDLPQVLIGGGIYEQEVITDACPNVDGFQNEVPIGFMKNVDGGCYEDICDNISGLQIILPSGYYKDGIDCHIVPLYLSELLSNASGVDTGKEFIEIYNPTQYTTSLSGYKLQFGSKTVALPDMEIAPATYVALSDLQTGITLTNTSGTLKLLGPDLTQLDVTTYQDARDDESWAFIDGVWQYTDNPTPNLANISMTAAVAEGETTDDNAVATCPAGKYRNPLTGRCKKYETESTPTPCKPDQERNPGTGRCRSIFSNTSSLTPCKPGQERNPETNRCRSIASAASKTLTPCKPGQERNPATNRCRKSVESANLASIKDSPSTMKSDGFGWLLAGGAMMSLGGYGVWEWRREITGGIQKIASIFGKTPPDL
jgi:hypothetical protein